MLPTSPATTCKIENTEVAGGDEVIELQLTKATKMKWQKEIDGKTGGSIFIYVQSETQPLQKHSELVFTLER